MIALGDISIPSEIYSNNFYKFFEESAKIFINEEI